MPSFRKRPIVIEAVQITDEWFDGDHPNDLHPIGVVIDPRTRQAFLDGAFRGKVGDWIITDPGHERSVCRADDFAVTYEPVTE